MSGSNTLRYQLLLITEVPPAPVLKGMSTKGKMSFIKENIIDLSEKMTPGLDMA